MKITIIFPGREMETAKAMPPIMPVAATLLAALTPDRHEVSIVDMFNGDAVDFHADVDIVAITVRTPLAVAAYRIADKFLGLGKKVFLGGPHVHVFPEEARGHATAVAIGEADDLWKVMLEDAEKDALRDYYVCGPYKVEQLKGRVFHQKNRPDLRGLPIPRRDLLPRKRYFMDSLFTTRGCPNRCRFCPVTDIFGGRIRHRPIDEVVAEVDTLGKRYFNVDDSVFGHPQIEDRPEENRYYLELYQELARLRPKRLWSGAGGLSAVNYKDGRKILELAAESGLSSIAAGLESISASGQTQSGAWRKLHYTAPDRFDLKQMQDNIRTFHEFGIEILGFFIIGWDEDTPDTFMRTLDFCDACNIIPFIFILSPMPGSPLYKEYLAAGRMIEDATWDQFGGGYITFRHPTMSEKQLFDLSREAVTRSYTNRRIAKRLLHGIRHRFPREVLIGSFFTQIGVRKTYRDLYRAIEAEKYL